MFSIEEEKQHKIWEDKYGEMELEEIKKFDEEAHWFFASMLSDDELECYDFELWLERKIDQSNFR